MIGIIEAKSAYQNAANGLQQAKEYAQTLGVKFAFATNGKTILEHNFITGKETEIDRFPSPDELWTRLRQAEGITDDVVAERILAPGYRVPGKPPRYYQEIAINRSIKTILSGKKRVLLTMATGTGKTLVAFQIIWKLWNAKSSSPVNCWLGGVRFAPDAPQGEAMVWEPVDQQVIPQSIAVSYQTTR